VSTKRVVIVTGATSGLGRAMAHALLDAGHRVVAFSRTQDALANFIAAANARWKGDRAWGAAGSVRSASDCENAVRVALEHFGSVDGLVNNAGLHLPTAGKRPKFFELTEEQWRSIVETHLTGAFLMTRAVAPHLIERGWGRVVNHETNYDTMARPGFSPYGAAKAGLEVATSAWAQELSGTGVTVNAILPGGVANVARISVEAFPERDKLVQPEVMGPPIVWLMSDASDGVTGRRFTARLWKPDASNEENVKASGAPAWPIGGRSA